MINDKKAGPLSAKRIAISLRQPAQERPHSFKTGEDTMTIKRTRPIQRGDIYYADLTPVTGSEQGGIRPVLILQNNVGNHHSPTVIAAAITGYVKGKRQPTHVRLKGAACGLFRDSTVLLEQVRTLDKSRLDEYMGSVGEDKMQEVDAALTISMGLKHT
jgi:mRNA interferase MazF